MAGKLKVDLTALAEASHELAAVAAELSDSDDRVHQVTASIGSTNETHKLRGAVENFSSKWKIRRGEIKQDVQYLSDMAAKVATELEGTDAGLATSLTAQPPTISSPSAPPQAYATPGHS